MNMNLLDVLLIAFIIYELVRGVRAGFVRQLISLLSVIVALVLASVVSPYIVPWFGQLGNRPLVSLMSFVLILLFIGIGAEAFNNYIQNKFYNHKKIEEIDRIGGAIAGLFFAVVSIWFLTAIFSSSAWPTLSGQIAKSRVVRTIDKVMPPPPRFIANIQNYLSNLDFPKVFIGLEPRLDKPVSLPPEGEVRSVALQAQDSVVKIVGPGCGNYLSDGSGFIAANGLVVTNAHVVAGITRPQVVDKQGSHSSRVVYFDPDIDLAILKTDVLGGSPPPINYSDMRRGEASVVAGYPGGGGYSAVSAIVIDKINAFGRNIYGQGEVQRPVYALRTRVVPGNSGGPLLNLRGEVTGVVFASSQTDGDVGYALTSQVLQKPLTQVRLNNSPPAVSSGRCMQR